MMRTETDACNEPTEAEIAQGSPYETSAPLRRQVEAMTGYGLVEKEIARVTGIEIDILRKYYRDELDIGHLKANAKVAESLFRKATGEGREAVTAAIFWLKARARWKETCAIEHGGPNGGPIQTEDMSERELARTIAFALAKAAHVGRG